MTTLLTIVVFILGIVLILKGGDMLVSSAVAFANKFKIPPLLVGATIVAIATTFPETTVSLIACSNGAVDIGLNTAVGAMVCNFTIVLGASFLLFPTKVSANSFLSKALFFIASVILLFIVSIDGKINYVEAGILLTNFIIFIIFSGIEASKHKNQDEFKPEPRSWINIIAVFLVASLAIGLGAVALVNNVEPISKILHIDSGIVGLVLVAVGTNIPELVTTITSVKLESPEIGIGNIFGASIINSSMLLGLSVFASKNSHMPISKSLILITVPILILITGIIVIPILKKQQTKRYQGVLLMLLYFIYTYLVIKLK